MASKRYNLILSEKANQDFIDILEYGFKNYGETVTLNYNNLINDAFDLLEIDPFRGGSKNQSEIIDNMRSYHLKIAKVNVKSPIKKPRHVIFYFTVDKDNKIIVTRILHDASERVFNIASHQEEVMRQIKEGKIKIPEIEKAKNRERPHSRDR